MSRKTPYEFAFDEVQKVLLITRMRSIHSGVYRIPVGEEVPVKMKGRSKNSISTSGIFQGYSPEGFVFMTISGKKRSSRNTSFLLNYDLEKFLVPGSRRVPLGELKPESIARAERRQRSAVSISKTMEEVIAPLLAATLETNRLLGELTPILAASAETNRLLGELLQAWNPNASRKGG